MSLNLENINQTEIKFPDDLTLNELFESQVERYRNNIAVICESDNFINQEHISYGELNAKANQVAGILRNSGIGPDDIVGIMVERSYTMIIGILAILKAGGAYLPIALENPENRIKFMLADSNVKLLLVRNKSLNSITFDGKIINLEDDNIYKGSKKNLKVANNVHNLAYVIYTSGSTGKPKGVMVEHISVLNRLNWMNKNYPLSNDDVILQKTPFYFDVSVWEIFWWFYGGAKMCLLAPKAEKIPLLIFSTIFKYKITIIHFVPSMLNQFLEYLKIKNSDELGKIKSIKKIYSSGESLSPSHVKKFNTIFKYYPEISITNLYGPTETTIDVSYYECPRNNDFNLIPIGKPIDNTKFYIIMGNELRNINQEGELCISGIGLARGYINNPDLTNTKFIENPFVDGERIYKTGDIARWLKDGNVEYLGREDSQVKISGLRIELGEIENVIREYKKIVDCVSTVKKYSETVILIIAYYVAEDEIDLEELKNYLRSQLPDYMVPNYFERISEIPLTANGKVDRSLLPQPKIKLNNKELS